MKEVDLLIVGGGCAGMAGALGAYEKGIRNILLLERNPRLGGILNQCIHNGFGLGEFKEELTGPEFASRFEKEIEKRKIPCLCDTYVTEITKDKVVRYSNKEGYFEVKAKAILFAAGCLERSAGSIALPGERPSGIMTAGLAQLLLNQYGYLPGERIFILGSGDIGLIMARRLTLEGAKVLGVAELCPWSNGLNRNIVQCLEDFDIPLYLSTTVTKTIGKSRLEAIELSNVDAQRKPIPGTERRIECDTLILSVGLLPNTHLLKDAGVRLGASKGAAVDESYETNVPGLFSAGNVLHVHDLADNVVSEARKAGEEAALYILGESKEKESSVAIKAGKNVGYVVPSFLSFPAKQGKISFKFRVSRPLKANSIVVKQGEEVRKTFFNPFLIPSEMKIIDIDASLFDPSKGDVEISVMEKEAPNAR